MKVNSLQSSSLTNDAVDDRHVPNDHTTNATRVNARTAKPFRIAAVLSLAVAIGLTNIADSPFASAADPQGLIGSFPPETGATLGSLIVSWQGEVLVNKTTAGFTAFSPSSGAASASPIGAGIVKAVTVAGSQLVWIDNTSNVKSSNPGGTVTSLGTVAGADAVLAVADSLWIAKPGSITRYAASPTLGAGTPLAATFNAASTLRMVVGPDGNVWVIENSATGVDTLTRWTTAGVQVGTTFNFTNSNANPSAITSSSDGGVWVVEGGINAVVRFDSNLQRVESPLPGGANPDSIVASPDGSGVWLTENGLNNVSRLTFGANTIARTTFAAPSAFGLKGVAIGPDGNVWAVGTVANRVAKFGTIIPATTTTTVLATTTTGAPISTVPATTVPAPTTTLAPATTAAPITTAAPRVIPAPVVTVRRVCVRRRTVVVRVNGKRVRRLVCVTYRTVRTVRR
jgi:streptogramin lyase